MANLSGQMLIVVFCVFITCRPPQVICFEFVAMALVGYAFTFCFLDRIVSYAMYVNLLAFSIVSPSYGSPFLRDPSEVGGRVPPGKCFVAFVLAYARSGLLVELDFK